MWYYPGDVISVRVRGVRHEGIMTEHGRVICNSRRHGGVTERSVRNFAEGRKIKNHGPLSNLSSDIVLARARAMLGRAYHPAQFNCEHFVRHCYGVDPYSPQKRQALGLAALAAAIAAL